MHEPQEDYIELNVYDNSLESLFRFKYLKVTTRFNRS